MSPLVASVSEFAPSLAAPDELPMPAFTPRTLLTGSPSAQDLFDYAMTAAKGARDRQADRNVRKHQLLIAVKTFKSLLENDAHKSFPHLDAALFEYGTTLQHAKYLKEARHVFDKLVKDHPASPFVVAAKIAYGDEHSNAKRYADAEAHYRAVLDSPRSALHAYAAYKLAWTYVHGQRWSEALAAMHDAVQATAGELTALARAARTDYVLVYAEAGKPEKALVTLRLVDPARTLDAYQDLAARYAARGMFDRAVYVYRDLVVHAPAKACTWRTQIARALLAMPGSHASARTEIDAVVKLAESSSDAECRAAGAALQSLEMRRYLAETAYARGDYADAATAFADIAGDLRTPRPLAIEAALASVLAHKTLLGIDPDRARLAKRSTRRKTALSTLETSLVEAHALYATLADDAELATMRFVEAAILRGHGDHEAAVPLLIDYLRVNPDDAHALRMLGDSREIMRTSVHDKGRSVRNRPSR